LTRDPQSAETLTVDTPDENGTGFLGVIAEGIGYKTRARVSLQTVGKTFYKISQRSGRLLRGRRARRHRRAHTH